MSIEIKNENLTTGIETGATAVETAPIPVQETPSLQTNSNPVPVPPLEKSIPSVEESIGMGGIKVSSEESNDPHSGNAWGATIREKKPLQEISAL